MFTRNVPIHEHLRHRSVFLFGPRQTGKSTLLRTRFPEALFVDLLNPKDFLVLTSRPNELESLVKAHIAQSRGEPCLVVIDEIQREPDLLNEVHRLIELHKQLRFVLTGSCPRKLRRGGVNLLGGRARMLNLHPISSPEMKTWREANVSFLMRLQRGGLPSILVSPDFRNDLLSYVGLYLQEEIQAEGLARNIGNFSRFLHVAAACSGEQVNYAAVASDAMVSARTVKDYFQILQDTMLGALVPPLNLSGKRKTVSTPKFYFFDTGVTNALLSRWDLAPGTPDYGKALESFIHGEVQAVAEYLSFDFPVTYWRTTTQLEVDFILRPRSGSLVAIEVKGNGRVDSRDTKGLRAFGEDFPTARKIVVCSEERERLTAEGVEIMPVELFLTKLWRGEITT